MLQRIMGSKQASWKELSLLEGLLCEVSQMIKKYWSGLAHPCNASLYKHGIILDYKVEFILENTVEQRGLLNFSV